MEVRRMLMIVLVNWRNPVQQFVSGAYCIVYTV